MFSVSTRSITRCREQIRSAGTQCQILGQRHCHQTREATGELRGKEQGRAQGKVLLALRGRCSSLGRVTEVLQGKVTLQHLRDTHTLSAPLRQLRL